MMGILTVLTVIFLVFSMVFILEGEFKEFCWCALCAALFHILKVFIYVI